MPLPKWFAHANVNTTDLSAAEAFYVSCFDLTPQWRTEPAQPQDGTGFGMPGQQVQWRGALLTDHRGLRGPLVDLLEWTLPATEGRPYEEPHHLGLSSLLFAVPSLEKTVARLQAAGAPADRLLIGATNTVVTADPGGTRIEVTEDPGRPAATYVGIRVNCSDLEVSSAFYRGALQLVAGDRQDATVVADGSVTGTFRSQRHVLPHRPDSFFVALTQWLDPVAIGVPYTTGNHAGIYRLALAVDDMADSWAELSDRYPEVPEPVVVDLGDDLVKMPAVFFPDPDGAIVEFLERGLT